MVLANKYFIAGLLVGYILCLLTGYILILFDNFKEKRKIDTKRHK